MHRHVERIRLVALSSRSKRRLYSEDKPNEQESFVLIIIGHRSAIIGQKASAFRGFRLIR